MTPRDAATARPWIYRAGCSPHDQAQIYDEESGRTIALTYSDEGGTNAALIVEAVNAYDRLTADNERLRKALATAISWCDNGDVCPQSIVNRLRAALAESERAK